MAIPPRPAALLLVTPAGVSLVGSQIRTIAATCQDPAACVLLLPAGFPALLPGVAVVAPIELGPKPPGWLLQHHQEDPGHLARCLPVSGRDIWLQHLQDFLNVLQTQLPFIQILQGCLRSQKCSHRIPLGGKGPPVLHLGILPLRTVECWGLYSPYPASYATCQHRAHQEGKV